jgi:hypothetical protein
VIDFVISARVGSRSGRDDMSALRGVERLIYLSSSSRSPGW